MAESYGSNSETPQPTNAVAEPRQQETSNSSFVAIDMIAKLVVLLVKVRTPKSFVSYCLCWLNDSLIMSLLLRHYVTLKCFLFDPFYVDCLSLLLTIGIGFQYSSDSSLNKVTLLTKVNS